MPELDHDAIRQLRELAAEGRRRADGLPGDRVRELGTRRHRRRIAATVAAASMAVVVVAGGAFTATAGLTGASDDPQPAETPSVVPSPAVKTTGAPMVVEAVDNTPPPGGWVTEIPAGYPLDRDLPDLGGDGRLSGPVQHLGVPGFHPCDSAGFPGDADTTDTLGLLRYTAPELRQQRQLVLFPDAAQAHAAVQQVVTDVRDCPREDLADGVGYRVHDWRSTDLGDIGVLTVTHVGQQGFGLVLGSEQHHLVRVGNAVLMVAESGEQLPDSPTERRWVRERTHLVDTLTDDMCVFAQRPCRRKASPSITEQGPRPSPKEATTAAEPSTRAEPSPRPEPAPTTRPVPTLPRSVLPTRAQTRYYEPGDLVPRSTVHGEGDGYVSVCQRGSLTDLGATDMWRRDFGFRRGGDMVMRSAALQFADARTAASAYATLRSWADGCRRTILERPEFDRADVNGRWYDTGPGEQRFTVLGYGPVPGDRYREMRFFDPTGIALVGDRIAVLSLVVAGQDWNWSYGPDGTGLDRDPMFDMLPEATANLRH